MPSGPPRPREGSKSQQRIGELLVEMGFITPDQLNTALSKQRQWGKRLGYVLVQSGYITEARLVRALARQLHIETCDPIGAPIHDRVRALIPRELALELHVVPLALQRAGDGEMLLVATSDPLNHTARELLEEKSGLKVVWLLAGETEIDLALARHYGTRAPSVLSGSGERRSPSGLAMSPLNPVRTPSTTNFAAIDVTPPPPSRSVVPNYALATPIELDASALEEIPEEIALDDPDPPSPRGYDLPDATMEMLDRKRPDSEARNQGRPSPAVRGPNDEAALDSWLAEEVALGGVDIAVDEESTPTITSRPIPSRTASAASGPAITGLPLQPTSSRPGRATPLPGPAPGRATPIPAATAPPKPPPRPHVPARPTPTEAMVRPPFAEPPIARPPPALTPIPGPLPTPLSASAATVRAPLPQATLLDGSDDGISSFGSWADLLPGGGPTGDLVGPSGALRSPRISSAPVPPALEARLPRAVLDAPSVSIDLDQPDEPQDTTPPIDRHQPIEIDLIETDMEPLDAPRTVVKPTSPFPIEPGAAAEPNLRGLPPAPLRLSDAPAGQPTPWTNEPPLLIGSPRTSDAPKPTESTFPLRANGRAGGTASLPPVAAAVATPAVAQAAHAGGATNAAVPSPRPIPPPSVTPVTKDLNPPPAPSQPARPAAAARSTPAATKPSGRRSSVPPNGPVEPRRVVAAKARAALLKLVATGTVDESSQRWLLRVMAALIVEHGMLDDEHFERAVAMVGESEPPPK